MIAAGPKDRHAPRPRSPRLLTLFVAAVRRRRGAETVLARSSSSGLHALSEETLLFYLGLEDGRDARRGGARPATSTSSGSGAWSTTSQVEKEPVAGGVQLIVTVSRAAGAALDRLRGPEAAVADRHQRAPARRIRSTCARAIRSTSASCTRLETVIEEMYREKGYRFADARYSIEEVSPTERRVDLHGRRGGEGAHRRHRVRRQQGLRRPPPALDDEEDQGERISITRMIKKDIYNPADARGGPREGARPLPRAPATRTRCSASRSSVGDRAERRRSAGCGIEVPIDEGKRCKLGEITIEGNERSHRRGAAPALPAAARRLAALQGDRRRAREGARRSTATPATSSPRSTPSWCERDGNVADLRDPRRPRATSTGSAGSSSRATRAPATRCCAASSGSRKGPSSTWARSRTACSRSTSSATSSSTRTSRSRSRTSTARRRRSTSLCKGQEADRTELQVGGGWSEALRLLRPVLGPAPRTSSAAASRWASRSSRARYANEFDVSYFVPWFLDKPQTIGVQIFNNELDYISARGAGLQSQQPGRRRSPTAGASGCSSNFSISYNRSELEGTTTTLRSGPPSRSSDHHRPRRTPRSARPSPTTAATTASSRRVGTALLGLASSTPAASWAATTTSSGRRSAASWFHPVTHVPVKTVFAINVEAG